MHKINEFKMLDHEVDGFRVRENGWSNYSYRGYDDGYYGHYFGSTVRQQ